MRGRDGCLGLLEGDCGFAISRDGYCGGPGIAVSPLRSTSPHTPAAREPHIAKRQAPTRQTQSERPRESLTRPRWRWFIECHLPTVVIYLRPEIRLRTFC